MNIRPIREDDSERFLGLCRTLDLETQFMMLEPGERKTTVEEQREMIASILTHDNQIIFVAEQDGLLVGYLGAFGGDYHRNWNCVYIVAGILQAYTGQGIGKRLFEALDVWAIDHQIHRLELTVMSHNEHAVNLYKKMGFSIEGVKKDSLWVNGEYIDEFYMAKLLG